MADPVRRLVGDESATGSSLVAPQLKVLARGDMDKDVGDVFRVASRSEVEVSVKPPVRGDSLADLDRSGYA